MTIQTWILFGVVINLLLYIILLHIKHKAFTFLLILGSLGMIFILWNKVPEMVFSLLVILTIFFLGKKEEKRYDQKVRKYLK